jgi:holo-[acyl-carrier protein] synthase
MSVIGIGIDIVECARIENSIERFGDRFLKRIFTEGEIAYSQSMKFPARHFAARFAAKEALSKAFGTGIGQAMGWRDLDVRKKESGEPYAVLSGGAEQMVKDRAIVKVWISLSHTENSASATIVLEA